MRTGEDVLKARAAERGVTLPADGKWPSELFGVLGLPTVVQCCECASTMAFPSTRLDEDGNTYCGDCADETRETDRPTHRFVVELVFSDREMLALTHDTTVAGTMPNAGMVASHVRAVVAADVEERLEAMRLLELSENDQKRGMSQSTQARSVSVHWLLSTLAGMTFPTQGGAYDYIATQLGMRTAEHQQ